IALLGTLFATRSHHVVTQQLASIPGAHPEKVATALQSGQLGQALAAVPVQLRGQVEHAAATAFTSGLNLILLVSAIIALVSGVVSLLSIRSQDFASHDS
ncbi:MAG: hypothetical protein ACRDTP_00720, partial [Mycobacteriales bacterium]